MIARILISRWSIDQLMICRLQVFLGLIMIDDVHTFPNQLIYDSGSQSEL